MLAGLNLLRWVFGPAYPLPILTIVLTTLVVNLRHLLMGASLYPWIAKLSRAKVYGLAFFVSDESWALTIREFETN